MSQNQEGPEEGHHLTRRIELLQAVAAGLEEHPHHPFTAEWILAHDVTVREWRALIQDLTTGARTQAAALTRIRDGIGKPAGHAGGGGA